jgi:hypothetical protein
VQGPRPEPRPWRLASAAMRRTAAGDSARRMPRLSNQARLAGRPTPGCRGRSAPARRSAGPRAAPPPRSARGTAGSSRSRRGPRLRSQSRSENCSSLVHLAGLDGWSPPAAARGRGRSSPGRTPRRRAPRRRRRRRRAAATSRRHAAAAGPGRQVEGHRLVLDQGQQRLLGADAGDVGRTPTWLRILSISSMKTMPRRTAGEEVVDRRLGPELLAGAGEQAAEHRLPGPPALGLLAEDVGVEADHGRAAASWGSAARYSSTARIRVVLPVPDEPIIRMLPAPGPARCLASATDISRTATGWPKTRRDRASAICLGEGSGWGGHLRRGMIAGYGGGRGPGEVGRRAGRDGLAMSRLYRRSPPRPRDPGRPAAATGGRHPRAEREEEQKNITALSWRSLGVPID